MTDNNSVGELQNQALVKDKHSIDKINEALKEDVLKETQFVSLNNAASASSAFQAEGFSRQTESNNKPEMSSLFDEKTKHATPDKSRLEDEERMRIITRLTRMAKQPGAPPIQFSLEDNLESLRKKNSLFTQHGRSAMVTGFMKKGIIFLGKISEELSKRVPGQALDLEGWSEHLSLTIDQYDSILYEIYDLYGREISEISPIFTLVMALGSNAVMYSMSRQMMKTKQRIQNQIFGGMQGSFKRSRPPVKKTQTPQPAAKKVKLSINDMSGPESDTETVTNETFISMNTETLEKEKLKTQGNYAPVEITSSKFKAPKPILKKSLPQPIGLENINDMSKLFGQDKGEMVRMALTPPASPRQKPQPAPSSSGGISEQKTASFSSSQKKDPKDSSSVNSEPGGVIKMSLK